MNTFLIDASLVLKSILNENPSVAIKFEELTKKALDGSVQIISNKLIVAEVANGIRYSERDSKLAQKYLDAFLALPIKFLTLSKVQYKKILTTSYELDATVYDTSYHVLAKAHNALFLTCDEKYYKKGKILGDIELVK